MRLGLTLPRFRTHTRIDGTESEIYTEAGLVNFWNQNWLVMNWSIGQFLSAQAYWGRLRNNYVSQKQSYWRDFVNQWRTIATVSVIHIAKIFATSSLWNFKIFCNSLAPSIFIHGRLSTGLDWTHPIRMSLYAFRMRWTVITSVCEIGKQGHRPLATTIDW